MAVQLNHTIVPVRDKQDLGRLSRRHPRSRSPEGLWAVRLRRDRQWREPRLRRSIGSGPPSLRLPVSEEEFDAIFARVTDRGITYWADPGHQEEKRINNHGRGFYFEDPSGHNLEVLTRPYGS